MKNLVVDEKKSIFNFDAKRNKKCCYRMINGIVYSTANNYNSYYNYSKAYFLFRKSNCEFFQLDGILYYGIIEPSKWGNIDLSKAAPVLRGEIV